MDNFSSSWRKWDDCTGWECPRTYYSSTLSISGKSLCENSIWFLGSFILRWLSRNQYLTKNGNLPIFLICVHGLSNIVEQFLYSQYRSIFNSIGQKETWYSCYVCNNSNFPVSRDLCVFGFGAIDSKHCKWCQSYLNGVKEFFWRVTVVIDW